MIILTHIGEKEPEYLYSFLTQLRLFNPYHEIVFLVNRKNTNNLIYHDFNIKTYPIEDLHNNLIDSFISKFGYGDVNSHKKNINYASTDYWCITATRLFYMCEYAKKFNINNYFHFENDIMIYEDIDNISNIIKNNDLYNNNISITRGTINKIMTGFSYISNNLLLENMLNDFCVYLNNKQELFKYGIDMINEMGLLHIYQMKNPDILKNLPIFPNNIISGNFNFFNSVFDPATYGQYLDGTPGSPGVSIITDSYIGDELRKNTSIRIDFESINNLKIPFLKIDNDYIKINNLHIHSKRLEKFKS